MQALQQRFARRPRILDLLHAAHLVRPYSQTVEVELAALQRHAGGRRRALEIGTFQGVSAERILRGMAADGVVYCVDPWLEANGRPNPCLRICERHFRRTRAAARIRILRGESHEVAHLMPDEVDFAFIDGDHSYEGLQTDWATVSPRVAPGGIVCLHDTVVPPGQPERKLPSVTYYADVISRDPRYALVEVVESMSVLRRV